MSSLLEGENEIKAWVGEEVDLYTLLDEEEIDSYCKHFSNFLQALFHRKYDPMSSRKCSRG